MEGRAETHGQCEISSSSSRLQKDLKQNYWAQAELLADFKKDLKQLKQNKSVHKPTILDSIDEDVACEPLFFKDVINGDGAENNVAHPWHTNYYAAQQMQAEHVASVEEQHALFNSLMKDGGSSVVCSQHTTCVSWINAKPACSQHAFDLQEGCPTCQKVVALFEKCSFAPV